MVTEQELLVAVDAAFKETGRGFDPWPDPHGEEGPADDEYSRLTDPGRYRIIGARADAWMQALAALGLATVDRGATVRWLSEVGVVFHRTDVVEPNAAGAWPLVVSRSRLGDVPDAGVWLGRQVPATTVVWLPQCGCDACDSGSDAELGQLDRHIGGIVTGSYRHLSRRGREITALGSREWAASGLGAGDDVQAILDHPAGWDVAQGASWLAT